MPQLSIMIPKTQLGLPMLQVEKRVLRGQLGEKRLLITDVSRKTRWCPRVRLSKSGVIVSGVMARYGRRDVELHDGLRDRTRYSVASVNTDQRVTHIGPGVRKPLSIRSRQVITARR